MCIALNVKCRSYCQILLKMKIFGQSFGKKLQISNFMKILPVGAEFLGMEGQTTWRS